MERKSCRGSKNQGIEVEMGMHGQRRDSEWKRMKGYG